MCFRIWEKKFGRNAHHKKKEEESKAQAPKIRNNTRPATPGSTRHSKADHPVDAGWNTRTVSAVVPATGRLHPSWEAKRRLKEKQSIGIVPSQGKKIKFS